MNPNSTLFDVAVVGGGPAGMIAATTAAARGLSVILLEKNHLVGKKLLTTGGGRCNLTNNKPVVREMLSKYKKSDKFLFSAFSQFSVTNTLDYFHSRGVPTKEENEGRTFPVSNSAQEVWDVLVLEMQKTGIKIKTDAKVLSIQKKIEEFSIILANKEEIRATSCIVATGGTSHPETGSSGDGYVWMRTLGHVVVEQDFALVPVALHDTWTKKLSGLTLPDIKLTVLQNGKKMRTEKGKILFTHFGVSGPTILNMSRDIGEWSQYAEVQIMLDLFPILDHRELKQKLQLLLVSESNKKVKNILSALLPKALVLPVLTLSGIDAETPSHSVRSEERTRLIQICKALPLHVKGLLGSDKAIVSSGGVPAEEIDFKTMQSRLIPNLFVVGDMLHIDRPSGGYSLQLCWTTGFVAGSHC